MIRIPRKGRKIKKKQGSGKREEAGVSEENPCDLYFF